MRELVDSNHAIDTEAPAGAPPASPCPNPYRRGVSCRHELAFADDRERRAHVEAHVHSSATLERHTGPFRRPALMSQMSSRRD